MMNNDEKYILDHYGKQNPFSVPEGYFDHLASNIMQQLPDAEQGSNGYVDKPKAKLVNMRSGLWHRARPFVGIAAGLCGVLFGVSVITHNAGSDASQQMAATESAVATQASSSTEYSEIDQMADYTMMDNEDLYAMMSDR